MPIRRNVTIRKVSKFYVHRTCMPNAPGTALLVKKLVRILIKQAILDGK